jgi:hypothetical protein
MKTGFLMYWFLLSWLWLCVVPAWEQRGLHSGNECLPIRRKLLIYDQIVHSCPSPGCIRCPTMPWQQSVFTLPLGQGIFRGLCNEQMPPLPFWSTICLGHQLLCNTVHPLIWRCKPHQSLLADALDGMGRQHCPQEWPLHHGRGLLVLPWRQPVLRPTTQVQ